MPLYFVCSRRDVHALPNSASWTQPWQMVDSGQTSGNKEEELSTHC